MLSRDGYLEQSLRLNLVFLRICKEHSFFLESSFTPRNTNLIETAACFRRQFNRLLQMAVDLSAGILGEGVLQSGQIVTPNTLQAELITQCYTGTVIDTSITKQQGQLQPGSAARAAHGIEAPVNELNQRSANLAVDLARFSEALISDAKACRLYLHMHPLQMDHINRETMNFISMLDMLMKHIDPLGGHGLVEQQGFWNRILADHAEFTGSMLDPTEQHLIDTSDRFAQEFSSLSQTTSRGQSDTAITQAVTHQLIGFETDLLRGIMGCGIRSMLLPLAVDHDLREANFYLYQIMNANHHS